MDQVFFQNQTNGIQQQSLYNSIKQVKEVKSHEKEGLSSQPNISIEEIMNYCYKSYKSILPTKMNSDFNSKDCFFPFETKQIVLLIKQIDIFVQLLLQLIQNKKNLLLTRDEDIRVKTYNLLINFENKKQKLLFWNKLPDDMRINLHSFTSPHYINIETLQDLNPGGPNFKENKCTLYYYPKPQVSLYQSPLLEFLDVFREIMRRNHDQENNLLLQLIHYIFPFINMESKAILKEQNSLYLMTAYYQMVQKSMVSSKLLINIIKLFFWNRNFNKISKDFLFDKTAQEIKNRYKNLIVSKSPDSIIKTWYQLSFEPLSEVQIKIFLLNNIQNEKQNFLKGLEWFGDSQSFNQISRYFLPHRTGEFLQSTYNNSDKLKKQRKKYYKKLNRQMTEEMQDFQQIYKQSIILKKCKVEQIQNFQNNDSNNKKNMGQQQSQKVRNINSQINLIKCKEQELDENLIKFEQISISSDNIFLEQEYLNENGAIIYDNEFNRLFKIANGITFEIDSIHSSEESLNKSNLDNRIETEVI